MKIEVGREYTSRRGERVLVTAIDAEGLWPVHYLVLTGRYKGVGARDGSRLTRDGRAYWQSDGSSPDHGNDLVAEGDEMVLERQDDGPLPADTWR